MNSHVTHRELVENAVALLVASLPAGWLRLHVEAQPSSQSLVAQASVTTADGQGQSVPVPPDVLAVLAEHQARATAARTPWRRLVIDCHADGRLSAYTDEVSRSHAPGAARWVSRALAGLTGCLLVAAAAVFTVGWRWGPPPRAEMIALPSAPPRQQAAFEVVDKWFDAENRGDAAAMLSVTCRQPAQTVMDWISSTAQFGQVEGLVFPDAVIGFRDEGAKVWVNASVRIRPISDSQKRVVQEQQRHGGFFSEELTLTDEGGALKVCDVLVHQQ